MALGSSLARLFAKLGFEDDRAYDGRVTSWRGPGRVAIVFRERRPKAVLPLGVRGQGFAYVDGSERRAARLHAGDRVPRQ